MGDRQLLELLTGEEPDAASMLLSSLAVMLRTGKPGVLGHRGVREVLAARIDEARLAPRDGVSDALCITRSRNQGNKKYGNAKYDFMVWYWGFMDQGTEPGKHDIGDWLEKQPTEVSDVGRGLDNWKREAKEAYEPVCRGAVRVNRFIGNTSN